MLEVPEGSAVLRVARRAKVEEKTLEVSRSTFRADRYTLWVAVRRPALSGARGACAPRRLECGHDRAARRRGAARP